MYPKIISTSCLLRFGCLGPMQLTLDSSKEKYRKPVDYQSLLYTSHTHVALSSLRRLSTVEIKTNDPTKQIRKFQSENRSRHQSSANSDAKTKSFEFRIKYAVNNQSGQLRNRLHVNRKCSLNIQKHIHIMTTEVECSAM